MRTEEQCKPGERFLMAEEYFSDKAIAIWKNECIARCKNMKKGIEYERYINWTKQENEIAVFTLYAYADFKIPKKFDIIFQLDDPDNFIKIDYHLIQCIHEAWFPVETISHGHKHLCIFKFENKIPGILETLHKGDKQKSTSPKDQRALGFCDNDDFEIIKRRQKRKIELRKIYGKEWWEHDDSDSL